MNFKIKKITKKAVIKYLPKKMSGYLQKIYFSRLVNNFKESREPELAVIKNLIKNGDWAIDIGSNIGVYTKFLSQFTGTKGKVFSIEPIPRTYEILCSNIKKLGLNNVEAINCACTDAIGFAVMEIPGSEEINEDFYGARIPLAGCPQNTWRKLKVECKTLDSLFLNFSQRIAFIKCDVEGSETKVFKGAVNLLAKFNPILFVEAAKDPDDPKSIACETFLFLKSQEYQPFYFDGNKLRTRKEGIRRTDYFFLKSGQIANLKEAGLLLE